MEYARETLPNLIPAPGAVVAPYQDSLKVSAHSRPSAVAGAIAGVIRSQPTVDVQAIGAGAINQAVKAIIIARSYLKDDGFDLVCVPSFLDVTIGTDERTAIRLLITRCNSAGA